MPDRIALTVNGTRIQLARGVTVAAAVAAAGESVFRHSASGGVRGPLCGMGICFECRLTVDGRRHVRSCQLMARDGMVVVTT